MDAPTKATIATDLIRTTRFGLSGQVLAEFFTIAVYKTAIAMSVAEAERWILQFSSFPMIPIDAALVQQGIVFSQQFQISYWDAAIIAAAERLEAPILYTEDLNHDQLYGSVRVINPFRAN